MRLLVVVMLGCLAGCAAGAGSEADGTFVGRLHTIAGRCPDDQPSDLSVSDGSVVFVPGDGVLELRGARDRSDPPAVHAQLLLPGMDRKGLPLVFDGRYSGGVVTGTYGTPTCRATISMRRPDLSFAKRIGVE